MTTPRQSHPSPYPAPLRTLSDYRRELRAFGSVCDLGFRLDLATLGYAPEINVWLVTAPNERPEMVQTERAALLRFAQLVRTERDAAKVREIAQSA